MKNVKRKIKNVNFRRKYSLRPQSRRDVEQAVLGPHLKLRGMKTGFESQGEERYAAQNEAATSQTRLVVGLAP
jgi:hypothetical protein